MILSDLGANVGYWAWIGTLYMVILTWQDHRRNRMSVDDRRNWFMLGLSISLISHFSHKWYYILWVLAVVVLFNVYAPRLAKRVGGADVSALSWLILGYALMSWVPLLVFFVIFALIALAYGLFKHGIEKALRVRRAVPFYIVFLLSFIVTNIALRLY